MRIVIIITVASHPSAASANQSRLNRGRRSGELQMHRFKRRPLGVAILSLFAVAPTSHAQTAPQGRQPEQTLPEVKVEGDSFRTETTTSATRTETPLRDIPQFI